MSILLLQTAIFLKDKRKHFLIVSTDMLTSYFAEYLSVASTSETLKYHVKSQESVHKVS